MIKIKYQTTFYILFICFLCWGILLASSVDCQYSTFTLSPPNTAIGYGGFFNPYVFWPGIGLKSAASTDSMASFLPFNYNSIFGLDNLLNTVTGFDTSLFNPLLGFGGLGGLGLNNTLGSLSLLGYYYLNPLPLTFPLALTTFSRINPGISAALGPVSPIRTAAQTGTWTGTWTSTYIAFPVLFHTGPMMLNIVEDPLLGTVVGTTILQGSRYASALTEVAGVIVNNVITLEGFLFTGFDIGLICYLTSPNTINGFYTVYGTHTPILDEGVFSLTLNPFVI